MRIESLFFAFNVCGLLRRVSPRPRAPKLSKSPSVHDPFRLLSPAHPSKCVCDI